MNIIVHEDTFKPIFNIFWMMNPLENFLLSTRHASRALSSACSIQFMTTEPNIQLREDKYY